jgi:hypothetical protein
MPRLHLLAIAFVGIATLSLTTAANSAQSSLSKKKGVTAPAEKTLNKNSDELAKKGLITPPQKALNKKNDEIAKRGIIIVSGKDKPGSDRMLNPQPLPPKEKGLSAKNNLGSDRMLNPQPLPPKAINTVGVKNSFGSERMLNPQPLPPKAMNNLSSDRMMTSSPQKALGSQKSY